MNPVFIPEASSYCEAGVTWYDKIGASYETEWAGGKQDINSIYTSV